MKKISIATVVGARPQFVKAAAISRAITALNRVHSETLVTESILHTGQHYDANMSKVFFDELQIPIPSTNLEVGSASHGKQTGIMLDKLEAAFIKLKPDWVLIYGDTNSTLAAALAAIKLHIPIAHVEAGLRSFNRRMPEEINRIIADTLSSLLFCPTAAAVRNLAHEGITQGVHKVGDVMYDSVLFYSELAEQQSSILETLGLKPGAYFLATVHRAENTDHPEHMQEILDAFCEIDRPVVWPIHPRTRNLLADKLQRLPDHICVVDPLPYFDMLKLEKNAQKILTDSGGVQKEAYWFKVPCITLREETEWVELVDAGFNMLCGPSRSRIIKALEADSPLTWGQDDLYGTGESSKSVIEIMLTAS